jgi:hypothetical protein
LTHVVVVSCRLTIHVFQLHYLLSATSAVTHFSIREDGQCVLCIAILFPTGNAFVLHDNLSDPFGCSGVYGQKRSFPEDQHLCQSPGNNSTTYLLAYLRRISPTT